MSVCPRCAAALQEVVESSPRSVPLTSASPSEDRQPQELMFETVLTATVIGLTVQFISFLFGLATQVVASLYENLLLSSFAGLCVGVIAFALLKGYDQVNLRHRVGVSSRRMAFQDYTQDA